VQGLVTILTEVLQSKANDVQSPCIDSADGGGERVRIDAQATRGAEGR